MLQNKEIAALFKLTGQLLELHDENPFKVKSYMAGAFRIERAGKPVATMPVEEMEKLDGFGKGTIGKITELVKTEKLKDLEELIAKTPSGVLDMLRVKGIGPKKVRTIWKELEVESVGELLYACNENRLVELKGFGSKTQEQVIKSIKYAMSNQGKYHFATLQNIGLVMVKKIQESMPEALVSLTGAIRRKCEVIECIDILIAQPSSEESFIKDLEQAEESKKNSSPTANDEDDSVPQNVKEIPFRTIECRYEEFYYKLFETTGSDEHLKLLGGEVIQGNYPSEEAIYKTFGLPYIIPELREGLHEIELAKKDLLNDIVELEDLKGIIHNHTTYSDGIHTLLEMAAHCKKLGYEYIAISDHSQAAQYAGGLKPERIIEQHKEIDELNKRMFPFRIFKSIEADILGDGSLDYDAEILSSFDFVIASVHSNLKMTAEKANARVLKAIENPFTTILGHPTGRLLLSREGYPIDHKLIIDACAANGVIIELNAHPYRLDLDWRWIQYAVSKGVKISINPDAHKMEGFNDMYYGVCAARKGGLTKQMTFNAMGLKEVEEYFLKRKERIVNHL